MVTTTAGKEDCPVCGAIISFLDRELGHDQCNVCGNVWSDNEDESPVINCGNGDAYSRADVYFQGEYDPIHDEWY